MSDLVQNRIQVRGKDYLVRELRGREMASVRKLLASDSEKFRAPAYVSSVACVEPALGNEKACEELPNVILQAILAEAIRLTNNPNSDPNAPEDENAKKA